MRGSTTALALCLGLLLTGCSASGPRSSPVPAPDVSVTGSDETGVLAAAGAGRFTSIDVRGDEEVSAAARRTTFQVWFGRQDGAFTMFVSGPVNITSVPVTVEGSTLTPDVEGLTGSAAGCADDGGSDCLLDAWLGRFVTRPLAVAVQGDELRISSGDQAMRLRRDTARGSRIRSNGRTLLTYPAAGDGAQALLKGVLGENAAQCVTVGGTVLIAPDTAKLLPDGSVVLGGADLRVGTRIEIGGGGSRSPEGSPCGGADADYFTVGDFPQG